MTGIIGFITLIGAILDIILFFKLWGMTNDIRELKKDHFDNRMPEDIPQLRAYLREKYILGENEKVKSILIHEFLDNINAKCNSSRLLFKNK